MRLLRDQGSVWPGRGPRRRGGWCLLAFSLRAKQTPPARARLGVVLMPSPHAPSEGPGQQQGLSGPPFAVYPRLPPPLTSPRPFLTISGHDLGCQLPEGRIFPCLEWRFPVLGPREGCEPRADGAGQALTSRGHRSHGLGGVTVPQLMPPSWKGWSGRMRLRDRTPVLGEPNNPNSVFVWPQRETRGDTAPSCAGGLWARGDLGV